MLEEALDKFGKELVKQTKRNVLSERMSTSGVLIDSIFYEIEKTRDGYELDFFMIEYGYYQDEGVQGANPRKVRYGRNKAPRSPFKFGSGGGKSKKKGGLSKSLDKWLVQKRIAPRDKKGRFVSRETIKFLISRSIYNQGLEPRLFFTKAWNKTLKGIDKKLEKAIVENVNQLFIELIGV